MLIAAVLGVIVPVALYAGTAGTGDTTLRAVLRIASLAVVPVLVARVAYRQGYDRGAADRSAA
jgi:hypothetical protein